jgi:hypothetical protein
LTATSLPIFLRFKPDGCEKANFVIRVVYNNTLSFATADVNLIVTVDKINPDHHFIAIATTRISDGTRMTTQWI